MVDDVLVTDKNGIPIPYKQINDMTA
jgi:hypothetical protein